MSVAPNFAGASPPSKPTHFYMLPSTPKFAYIDSGEEWESLPEDDLYSEIMECGVPLLELLAKVARGYQKGNPIALLSKAIGVAACDAPGVSIATGIAGRPVPLNFLFCLVGPSGLGKGTTLDARLSCANPMGGYRNTTPASGEALIASFFDTVPAADGKGMETEQHKDPVWASWGEIDAFAAKSGSSGSTLDAIMRSLWTGEAAGDESISRMKAGIGCRVEEDSYRFVMFVGAQPDHAGVLLEDATGGTIQRLLWFPLPDDDAPETSADIRAYKRDLEVTLGVPHNSLQLGSPDLKVWGPSQVSVSNDVIETMEENRSRILRRVENLDPLDAHRDNLRTRLAAIFAGWRAGHGNPALIDNEAWWWAGCVLEYSRRTRNACVIAARSKKMFDAREEGKAEGERFLARSAHIESQKEKALTAALDRVFEILEEGLWKKGSKNPSPLGATAGDVSRHVSTTYRKQTQDLINIHVMDGSVIAEKDHTGRMRYRVRES